MNDAGTSETDGRCGESGVRALSSGFSKHNMNPFIIEVVEDGSGCIASATYARHEIVGIMLMTDCSRATMSG